jgi:uncharacterized integral membrane protein (TIGR00698 family)
MIDMPVPARSTHHGLLRSLPGILLCILVTGLATALQLVETLLVGQPYLEALVLAILLGVAIRSVWTPSDLWHPGIVFSGKILLEIAVVLLGTAISARAVLALGPGLLIGIVVIVAVAIVTSYGISRAFRLPWRMAMLIACGNSICGNSAIAAVAPIIGADSDDIASSIAFTAVLGVAVVLLLPLLVPVFLLSLTQYGVLAGLTVYAVPQVLAATLPIGALSNQVGTVVKLVRVLTLGPVVLSLSLLTRRMRDEADGAVSQATRTKRRYPPLHELVPWFIVGFLIMLTLRSTSMIPTSLVAPITRIANLLTTISMAALGLSVDVRVVALAGPRVAAAVTLSLVMLGVISFGLIRILRVG